VNQPQSRNGRIALIIQDTAITLIAEMMVLVAFFIFYRLLLDVYGSDNLGLYALSRRVIAFLIPLMLLGLYDGMGRYLAMAVDAGERSVIIIVSLAALLFMSVSAVLVLNWDRDVSAEVIFGSAGYATLVAPFCAIVIGLSLHTFAHAALRGSMKIKLLNTLQLANLGLLPILLVKYYDVEFPSLLFAMGLMHGVVAVIPVLLMVYAGFSNMPRKKWRSAVMELFAYSIPRIPNGMVAAGLVALGPVLATGHMSMTEVGYLALSFSLLIGISSFVSPLGLVLLPHMSKAVVTNKTHIIGEKLHLLIGSVVQMLLFVCTQFLVFADFIIELWMGPDYLPAVPVITVVFISILFYGFYVATRSILDAVSVKPVNSINTMITLVFLLISTQLGLHWFETFSPSILLAVIFTLSMALLGGLTYRSLRNRLPDSSRRDGRHLVWGILLNGVFGLIALSLHSQIVEHLVLFIAFEMGVLVLYIWLLSKLGFEWVFIFMDNLPFGVRKAGSA
jgi:O-antigen/teichoic acid export membrane protein